MAAQDTFGQPGSLNAPAYHAETVTPSDGGDLSFVSRALYVGVTGNLTVIMAGGETILFTAVPAGTVLPIAVSRVKATGTTASSIVSIR